MEKEESRNTTDKAIPSLIDLSERYFCKTPQSEKEEVILAHLVAYHIKTMEDIAYQHFQPIVWKADFDYLYSAAWNLYGYYVWLISQHKDRFIDILKIFGKEQNDNDKVFRMVQLDFYTSQASLCKSAESWHQKAFTDIVLMVRDRLAVNRLIGQLSRVSHDNRAIFDFGEYKPFDGYFTEWGLDGLHTGVVEKRIMKILQKDGMKGIEAKYPEEYPRNLFNLFESLKEEHFISRGFYSRIDRDHGKVTRFIEKWLERVRELEPADALRMFYDGVLRQFTKKRAYDRVTNELTDERLQKRGGKSLKEIGMKIAELRIDKNISQVELSRITNLSEKYISQIERGIQSRLYKTSISKIASALDVDVDFIIGGKTTIQTDFQEHDDDIEEEFTESVQITYGENDQTFTLVEGLTLVQNLMKKYPPQSDHHRVLKAISDADFPISKRDRGKKRLIDQSEIARKAGISRNRVRKILKDLKDDPYLLRFRNHS